MKTISAFFVFNRGRSDVYSSANFFFLSERARLHNTNLFALFLVIIFLYIDLLTPSLLFFFLQIFISDTSPNVSKKYFFFSLRFPAPSCLLFVVCISCAGIGASFRIGQFFFIIPFTYSFKSNIFL